MVSRGVKPIISETPETILLRMDEYFEYEFTADVETTYWTMRNLPVEVREDRDGFIAGFSFLVELGFLNGKERLEKYKILLKFRNIPFDADLFTWNSD